jgi:hypothetical protein
LALPLFSGGYWYRLSDGGWFISAQDGGPWYGIAVESVPMSVMLVPVYREGDAALTDATYRSVYGMRTAAITDMAIMKISTTKGSG